MLSTRLIVSLILTHLLIPLTLANNPSVLSKQSDISLEASLPDSSSMPLKVQLPPFFYRINISQPEKIINSKLVPPSAKFQHPPPILSDLHGMSMQWFQCPNSSTLLSIDQICHGKAHCADKDEPAFENRRSQDVNPEETSKLFKFAWIMLIIIYLPFLIIFLLYIFISKLEYNHSEKCAHFSLSQQFGASLLFQNDEIEEVAESLVGITTETTPIPANEDVDELDNIQIFPDSIEAVTSLHCEAINTSHEGTECNDEHFQMETSKPSERQQISSTSCVDDDQINYGTIEKNQMQVKAISNPVESERSGKLNQSFTTSTPISSISPFDQSANIAINDEILGTSNDERLSPVETDILAESALNSSIKGSNLQVALIKNSPDELDSNLNSTVRTPSRSLSAEPVTTITINGPSKCRFSLELKYDE